MKRPFQKYAALLAALCLCFLYPAGCDMYGYGTIGGAGENVPGVLPGRLYGQWVYAGERYTISAGSIIDTIKYEYTGGASSPFDFEGTIAFVSNYNDSSGVIIVEYNVQRPTYPLHNGNFYGAVYYRYLTASSVKLANAINLADMSAPDTVTFSEAVTKFNRNNQGSFVNWGNVQPQRKQ
ncbi:MAG: hypothetical protein LBB82_11170 [Treponema sp.]|jgi:hypothetical protein|nr:hypothetical protein [Treponema sp.]